MEATVNHSDDLAPASGWSGVLKEDGWYLTALRKSLKLNDDQWRLFLRQRAEENMAHRRGITLN